ncbi:Conserved_hypothetical protein [Hexamita inflata]|uniref:Condensation domain-containing protein n=1 Tax=Hexamita inflata TaxID=28002 RepID=A0AA86PLL1_9EUKA|nr:Conserved hypothetical protein [Hexamita inflata]
MPLSNFQDNSNFLLNKTINLKQCRLHNEKRSLTTSQIIRNGQDQVISIGCFIEDTSFSSSIAQKTWDLIFQQYPFMTSKIIINETEKWQYFEPQQNQPKLPGNIFEISSQQQLDNVLNMTCASDSKLVHIDLYKMKVEGLPFRFLMMFQVAHSISDGSTTTFLLQRFNKYYTQLQRGEEVKLDFVQKGPFTMVSAYPEDADIGPSTSSNYKGLALTPVKVFHETEPKIQYHKYHIRFQKKSEFSFKKFKGATVSHSMYATQIIMQCAFMYYTKQLKEDETAHQLVSDLINESEFLAQHGNCKQKLEDIFGNTSVELPIQVSVNMNSTVEEILKQLQQASKSYKNMDTKKHWEYLLASDHPVIQKQFISSISSQILSLLTSSPISLFSVAQIQLNNNEPNLFNFTAVSTPQYVCINHQIFDGFSTSDFDAFHSIFKQIQTEVDLNGTKLNTIEVIQFFVQKFGERNGFKKKNGKKVEVFHFKK